MLAEVAVPQVLQVELHPLLQRKRLRAYCEAHGILLQAYGHHHAELRDHMPLQAVAMSSSPSAIGLAAMRWSLQVQHVQPPHALTSFVSTVPSTHGGVLRPSLGPWPCSSPPRPTPLPEPRQRRRALPSSLARAAWSM